MTCVGSGNNNSFSILSSLDQSISCDSTQATQNNFFKKGVLRNSTLVAGKPQRDTVQHCDQQRPHKPFPRQNGGNGPKFAETCGRNSVDHREFPPRAPRPPRFQNKPVESRVPPRGFCNPTPMRPCLTAIPTSEKELLDARLRQEVSAALQNGPGATCTVIPESMIQPICSPIPSNVNTPQPVRIPCRSTESTAKKDVIVSSTPTQRTVVREQLPHTPEVVSRTPTNGSALSDPPEKVNESLPRPPGLSKPSGRRPDYNHRTRALTKPSNQEQRLNQAVGNSSFECHIDPEVTSRVISPPPSEATPNTVKLPASKNTPHSPATTASSLSEDPSGGFSVLLSDTTFTSVDSNMSNISGKVSQHGKLSRPICWGWRDGRPCSKVPCPYHHPPRPDQPANAATRPTQPSTVPPTSSAVVETSVHVRESNNDLIPRKQEDPPRGNAVDSNISNISNKVSQPNRNMSRRICHKWMNGRSCYGDPCPYRHPPRPGQPANAATRPTQPSTVPPTSSAAVNTSVHARELNNGLIPRAQGPLCGNAEPLQWPESLYATTISDHIKVQFDQGFEIRDVVTGFESRWVHLGNIAGSVTSATLNELLGPYKVENIKFPEPSDPEPSEKLVTVKVQFATAADAIKAVTDLNGIEFVRRTISAKLAINNSSRGNMVLTDTDVQLIWQCPFRVGYAGYDTLKEAKAVIDSLNGSQMEYLVVSAQLYEGIPCVGAYNVIFKQLPASVTEQGLRKFANSKAVMLGRPNYQSLDKAVSSIRSRLEEYGMITRFDVISPPYKDGMVKAWASFTSPTEARAAQSDLDHRRPKAIGHNYLSCRNVVSLSHVLAAASYKKMREDIGWLRWSWQRRYGPSVSIREKIKENASDDAPTYIKLSSEQPELLSILKYEFEQLLHGETITLDKKPLWDDFLVAETGHTYISQLHAQYPGVQIRVQNRSRVISLWGPIVMRHRARQDIVRKVMELKAQEFWTIPLSGKILGIFCSAELSTLQGLLGSENCVLDFGERVLLVRGNDLAFRTACKAVQDAQRRQGDVVRASGVICPVCFDEAVVPVSLACGHQWCRTCLTGYLASAVENRMFPLRCLGNDATCTQCIPLGLSRKLLSADAFNAVIEAAFWTYVHSRPEEFRHCPTPDCTQVYRSAPPNAVLQCPSCLVRICPSCRIEYHDGMTCEERDIADDKLFSEWSSNHDVKSCPGCKAPIERSEGCNHMTCTRCQTHICWECLATFPRGQGIYDHMRTHHGGIGL